MSCSEGGDLDALSLRVEVFVSQTSILALGGGGAEGEGLHSVVVEGADGVEVGAGCQLLQLLLGVVQIEDLLDAVEVLADVVLVNADAQSLVDLPLHILIFVFNLLYNHLLFSICIEK